MDKENDNNHQTEEDNSRNVAMAKETVYKKLDFSSINSCEKVITSEEALKDVVPMSWSENALNGEKKVIIKRR